MDSGKKVATLVSLETFERLGAINTYLSSLEAIDVFKGHTAQDKNREILSRMILTQHRIINEVLENATVWKETEDGEI